MSLLNKPLTLESMHLTKTEPYQGWRIVSFVIVAIMIAAVIGSSYFVYNHVYRTLEDAHTIVILQAGPSLHTLNIQQFEKAEKLHGFKQTTTTIETTLRNVFIFPTSTSITSSPKTSR